MALLDGDKLIKDLLKERCNLENLDMTIGDFMFSLRADLQNGSYNAELPEELAKVTAERDALANELAISESSDELRTEEWAKSQRQLAAALEGWRKSECCILWLRSQGDNHCSGCNPLVSKNKGYCQAVLDHCAVVTCTDKEG